MLSNASEIVQVIKTTLFSNCNIVKLNKELENANSDETNLVKLISQKWPIPIDTSSIDSSSKLHHHANCIKVVQNLKIKPRQQNTKKVYPSKVIYDRYTPLKLPLEKNIQFENKYFKVNKYKEHQGLLKQKLITELLGKKRSPTFDSRYYPTSTKGKSQRIKVELFKTVPSHYSDGSSKFIGKICYDHYFDLLFSKCDHLLLINAKAFNYMWDLQTVPTEHQVERPESIISLVKKYLDNPQWQLDPSIIVELVV
jgi:hypothetical protein